MSLGISSICDNADKVSLFVMVGDDGWNVVPISIFTEDMSEKVRGTRVQGYRIVEASYLVDDDKYKDSSRIVEKGRL